MWSVGMIASYRWFPFYVLFQLPENTTAGGRGRGCWWCFSSQEMLLPQNTIGSWRWEEPWSNEYWGLEFFMHSIIEDSGPAFYGVQLDME